MEIKPTEPNALIYMANALRKGQGIANKVNVPVLGPAGDLLLGDAATTAEQLSYGEFPGKGSGMTTQLDPGVVDLAGLVYGPASLAATKSAQLASRLRSSIPSSIPSPIAGPTDLSRREFMKKGAAGTAAAAAAGTGAYGAKKLFDELAIATAAPVSKGLTKELLASHVDNIARDFFEYNVDPELLDSNLINADTLRDFVSPEAYKHVEDYISGLSSKYGDEFEPEGLVDRMRFESDTPMDGPSSYAREEASKKFMERPDANEIIERYWATGKWPEGFDEKSFSGGWYNAAKTFNELPRLPFEENFVNRMYDDLITVVPSLGDL